MKRRDAIKRLGLATGAVIATPAILSLLNSCTTKAEQWVPKFLSPKQGQLLTKLVNVFLPKTQDLPSATELNVPEFIDRYIAEIYDEKKQEQTKLAFGEITQKVELHTGLEIEQLKANDLEGFLDEYLKTSNEIDEERIANPTFEGMTTSELLNSIKYLSIKAYLTNEEVGKQVLAYDPYPGDYFCGDLEELTQGKRWALQ
jgi:hypothetical protein